jgi:hypothetical protein
MPPITRRMTRQLTRLAEISDIDNEDGGVFTRTRQRKRFAVNERENASEGEVMRKRPRNRRISRTEEAIEIQESTEHNDKEPLCTRLRRTTRKAVPEMYVEWESILGEEEEIDKGEEEETDHTYSDGVDAWLSEEEEEEEEDGDPLSIDYDVVDAGLAGEEEIRRSSHGSEYIIAVQAVLSAGRRRCIPHDASVKVLAPEWAVVVNYSGVNIGGRAIHDCMLCGNGNIRYKFRLQNKHNPELSIYPVGSKCVQMMVKWGASAWIDIQEISEDTIKTFVNRVKAKGAEIDKMLQGIPS